MSRGMTLNEMMTYVVENCINCGVTFALSEPFRNQRISDKKTWYCPNGHQMQYTESEEDRLRRQLEAERRRTANAEEQARAAWADAEVERQSHAATKGLLTKAKKQVQRAENGVCTICHRSFPNVRDHMRSKHGDAAEAAQVARERGHKEHGVASKAKSHWENWRLDDLRVLAHREYGVKNVKKFSKSDLIHEMRLRAQQEK